MSDCSSIELLIAAYVDNELEPADLEIVRRHLNQCPPCDARASAERAVYHLVSNGRQSLRGEVAPESLRTKCRALAQAAGQDAPAASAPRLWQQHRLAPLAFAATLVLIVGAAFLYQLTSTSSRIMVAQLAADHVKCFAMNGVLGTHQSTEVVESNMAAGFGWIAHLPERPDTEGLELVGARQCLYGEGRVAHIMYRHNGRDASLFMLPRNRGENEVFDVLGHQAAIWSADDRTFVLIAREARSDVQRLASFVRSSMH